MVPLPVLSLFGAVPQQMTGDSELPISILWRPLTKAPLAGSLARMAYVIVGARPQDGYPHQNRRAAQRQDTMWQEAVRLGARQARLPILGITTFVPISFSS